MWGHLAENIDLELLHPQLKTLNPWLKQREKEEDSTSMTNGCDCNDCECRLGLRGNG